MAQAQKLASSVNDRTYQEVEYLKKSLGPILVAALAEICIRRPADPIEYLGHWLLRWRYNEELKRRDVQNAMDVVKARQWSQVAEEAEALQSAEANVPEPVSTDIPGTEVEPRSQKASADLDTQLLYTAPDEATDRRSSSVSGAGGEKKKSSVLGSLSGSRKPSGLAEGAEGAESPLKAGSFDGGSKRGSTVAEPRKGSGKTSANASRKSSKKMSQSAEEPAISRQVSLGGAGAELSEAPEVPPTEEPPEPEPAEPVPEVVEAEE